MDPITHALLFSVVLVLAGRKEYLAYGITGAVILDIDVTFQLISDHYPGLYIFTHGGITHSIAGAIITSLAGLIVLSFLSDKFRHVHPHAASKLGPAAALTVVAAALSHIAIDYLAFPGIPLFYPLSDAKYTLGIMGGPSSLLTVASIAYTALILSGKASIGRPQAYIAVFLVIIALSTGLKLYVDMNTAGTTIPSADPLKWMVIEERPDSYIIYNYYIAGGAETGKTFEKYRDIMPADAERYKWLPEVMRFHYHSYTVTVEKNTSGILFHDPFRENGYVWYPPYYKTVTVTDSSIRPLF